MKQKLRIKLFGGLSVYAEDSKQWKALTDFSDKGIGKKQQEFLTYLILNHGRKITGTELMERFWDGEGTAPANSLKNMMYKTRTLLQTILPDADELIVTQPGGYEWSKNYLLDVDVEVFEQLYRGLDCSTQEGQSQAYTAFELYTGDILPGVSSDWLDHLNTYYRTVFIDIF